MKPIKFNILLIITVAFLINSCSKKQVPTPVDGTPIFLFEGNANGAAINIYAGKNDYYMFTNDYKDTLNVFSFTGNLRPNSCTTCGPQVTVEFRDSKLRTNTTISDIQNTLKAGTFNIKNGTTTYQTVQKELFQFTAITFANNRYHWDFGDGDTSAIQNPSHLFKTNGAHTVCLKTYSSGTPNTSTVCNTINSSASCRIQFTDSVNNSNDSVTFFGNSGFNSYYWTLGDSNTTSTLQNPYHHYTTSGIYVISLSAISSSSCTSVFSKNIPVGIGINGAVASYNYTVSTVPVIVPIGDTAYNKVVIKYVSTDGKSYSSSKTNAATTQSGSYFTVTNVSSYNNNSAGLRTYKLQGNLKAWLYNITNATDSVQIQGDKFTIAVGYP